MLKNTVKLTFLTVIIFTFAAACGNFTASAPPASGSSAKVTLILPEGVSLKPSGEIVSGDRALNAATITNITLTVSAVDIKSITESIPLDTLEIEVEVPSGVNRTFSVSVETDSGITFTGTETINLAPDNVVALTIDIYILSSDTVLLTGNWELTDSTGTYKLNFESNTLKHTDSGGCETTGSFAATESAITVTFTSYSGACDPNTGSTWDLNTGLDWLYSVSGIYLYLYDMPGNLVFTRISDTTLIDGTWELTDSTGTYTITFDSASRTATHTDPAGCTVSGTYTDSGSTITVTFTSSSGTCDTTLVGLAMDFNNPLDWPYYVTDTSLYLFEVPVNLTFTRTSSTGIAVPSAPVNVTITAGDSQVTIAWDAVTGATSYVIHWSTSSGVTASTGTVVSGITSTSYTHTGLTNGTTYYYVVLASNSAGDSSASSEVSAVPAVTVVKADR